MSKSDQIIVLGAGGHAKVAIDTLNAVGAKIIGITDRNSATHGSIICGLPVLATKLSYRGWRASFRVSHDEEYLHIESDVLVLDAKPHANGRYTLSGGFA